MLGRYCYLQTVSLLPWTKSLTVSYFQKLEPSSVVEILGTVWNLQNVVTNQLKTVSVDDFQYCFQLQEQCRHVRVDLLDTDVKDDGMIYMRVDPKVIPSIYSYGNYHRYREHNNTNVGNEYSPAHWYLYLRKWPLLFTVVTFIEKCYPGFINPVHADELTVWSATRNDKIPLYLMMDNTVNNI